MINYPNQEGISLELLIDYNENLIKIIKEITNKIELASEDIKIKQSELQEHSLENLINQENELEDKCVGIQFKIETYINFLKEKLGIDVSSEDKEFLLNMLKLRELQYNSDLENNKSLLNEYKKLKNYTENIFDFLQSEVSKLARAKKEKELSILVNNVEPMIKKEKEEVKEYLKNKVQDFFHEVLTNKLYEKIDPHPDYKNVVFSPNFDSEKPRLDVFVRNEKNEKTLIPNLYFSTAQINILSLCIFLASALNAKKYNCIFIDYNVSKFAIHFAFGNNSFFLNTQ